MSSSCLQSYKYLTSPQFLPSMTDRVHYGVSTMFVGSGLLGVFISKVSTL